MALSVAQLMLAVVQFLAVFLLVYALFRVRVNPEPPINRRIALAIGAYQRSTIFENAMLRPFMNMALAAAYRFPFLRKRVRQDLEASGNPNGYSVEEYLAIMMFTGGIVTLISMSMLGLFGRWYLLILPILIMMGFYFPLALLSGAARRRCNAIAKRLPYTLDLVALMMGAGASFSEAIQTLIQDNPHDEFNQELAMVESEMEFGTSRAAALVNMAERIPLESLRSVVGAVNQAEALGTPLSTILQSQSTMLREQRSMKAEDASAKASTRILIPATLILVAVLLVVLGPTVILPAIRGNLWNSSLPEQGMTPAQSPAATYVAKAEKREQPMGFVHG